MNTKIFLVLVISTVVHGETQLAMVSQGRAPDSTQKRLAELREADRRSIPLDVSIQASTAYRTREPIPVTLTLTNLFEQPLVLNSRMLVNHPLMQGEIYFEVLGPDGKQMEIQHLVTPMPVRDEDFVVLPHGHSIQRTIDLADLYGLRKKGLYRVSACYHNEFDKDVHGQLAWHGSIVSDAVEIRLN